MLSLHFGGQQWLHLQGQEDFYGTVFTLKLKIILTFETSGTNSTIRRHMSEGFKRFAKNIGIFLNGFHKPVAVILHRYDTCRLPHTGKIQFPYLADSNWLVGCSEATKCYIYGNRHDGSCANILQQQT
jgi:hypothetical protein